MTNLERGRKKGKITEGIEEDEERNRERADEERNRERNIVK